MKKIKIKYVFAVLAAIWFLLMVSAVVWKKDYSEAQFCLAMSILCLKDVQIRVLEDEIEELQSKED